MADTAFDPDAYLSGATSAPTASPMPANDSTASPAGGFDPDSYLAASGEPSDSNQIPGVLSEMGSAEGAAFQGMAEGLGPSNIQQMAEESKNLPFWDITPELRSIWRTGKGLASAAAVPVAWAYGGLESALAKPYAKLQEVTGTNIDRDKLKGLLNSGVQKEEAIRQSTLSPLQTYEQAKGDVSTALAAARPYGDLSMVPVPGGGKAPEFEARSSFNRPKPPEQPPQPPIAPERRPFGVTLSEGEAENNLAKRIEEQNFLRRGDSHAQQWMDQRRAELGEAPLTAAEGLTPELIAQRAQEGFAGPVITQPQEAADIVRAALDQQHDHIGSVLQRSQQSLTDLHNGIRGSLSPSGEVYARSPLDAADVFSQAVTTEAERVQAAKNAAYQAAQELPGNYHPAAFNNASTKLRSAVTRSSNIDINPDSTPIADSTLKRLPEIFKDLTQERDLETGRIIKKEPITPQVLENVRKRLNVRLGDAKAAAFGPGGKPSDYRAMQGIVSAFDDLIEDRLAKGTFSGGDPTAALEAFKKARQLNTQYRRTFSSQGAGDQVGQTIQKILGRYEGQEATPEQLQRDLYGQGALPVKVARRLLAMFPADSPVVGAAKQGYYSYITERPPGMQQWGPAQVAGRIDQFVNGPGRTLTQTYFSPDEIGKLRGLSARLKQHAQLSDAFESEPLRNIDTDALLRRVVTTGDNKSMNLLDRTLSRLNPEESDVLRHGLFLQGIRPVEGVADWGPGKVADNLSKLLKHTRDSYIYSPEQRNVIASYRDFLRRIEMPKGTYSPSGPAIEQLKHVVGMRTAQLIGGAIGRLTGSWPGELIGITTGGQLEGMLERKFAGRIRSQLPLVADATRRYQQALRNFDPNKPGSNKLLMGAAANLSESLSKLGISIPPIQLPGMGQAEQPSKNRADGGGLPIDQTAEIEREANYNDGKAMLRDKWLAQNLDPVMPGTNYNDTPTWQQDFRDREEKGAFNAQDLRDLSKEMEEQGRASQDMFPAENYGFENSPDSIAQTRGLADGGAPDVSVMPERPALESEAEAQEDEIPGPPSEQPDRDEIAVPQNRAQGGRVDPNNIDHNPSEAQKKAGNYRKDSIHFQGIPIVIENAKGKTRSGIGKDGKPWSVQMPHHYGYVRGTIGQDKDPVDVYLGPHTKSPHVFIIGQVDADTKKADECKVMLGFGSEKQAVESYKKGFSDGRGADRIGNVISMTMAEFKDWLRHGDTEKPFADPTIRKMSHKAAGYIVHSEYPNKYCSVCKFWIPEEHGGPACTKVKSPVDAAGWCRYFARHI